jgi:membrane-associated phospholipid phosphatase
MLKILINNRTFFIIFLLWVIFGALLQLFYTQTELMFWINRHHNSLLDTFFRYVTLFGEDYTWLLLLLYFVFVNYFQGIKKSNEIKMLVISWLAKVFLSVSLKNIFNLPRPIEVYQNTGQEIHLVNGVEIAHWQSFPSGHTMTAFAFACFILLYLKQKKLAIIALFLAILVAYSRMYLFQHFPRDVFAGGILGLSVVSIILTLSLQKKRRTTK